MGSAMAANIVDVARRAGVSTATVSRVLNGSPRVLPATKQRVLVAIDELGYHPNQAARQLATARTDTIGVLLPFITRPFVVNVLRGIEATIAEADYNLVIFNVESIDQHQRYFTSMSFVGRIDGLIVLSLPLTQPELTRLSRAHVPTVFIDINVPGWTSVSVDNVAGARMAVEHLIAHGHRRIGYISGPFIPELGFPVNQERLQGYTDALKAHGLAVYDEYIWSGDDGRAAGHQAMHTLLELDSPPTAVFASSDEHAFGVIDAIKEHNLLPGQDIAVVGFDDLELARYVGLTTIHQPMEQMGRMGARALFSMLHHTATPASHIIPLSLVVRATSGTPGCVVPATDVRSTYGVHSTPSFLA